MENLITYKDRLDFIQNEEIDVEELLNLLKDENELVRVETLKKMTNFTNTNIFTIELLEKIHHLILDHNTEVRLQFAELLKKFSNIHVRDKERLFDVYDMGLFVYAVEDEDFYVKKAVIESLFYFLIPRAISFLIDLLNEDNVQLRVTVSSILRKCTELKMKENVYLKPLDEQLDFIFDCLHESNTQIFENILFILINLYTDDEKMFFELSDLNFPNDKIKYKVLHQLIINNSDVYVKYINRELDYKLNNNCDILDQTYFGQIFILKNLIDYFNSINEESNSINSLKSEKHKKMYISPKVEEDIAFVVFKLKQIFYTESKNILDELLNNLYIDNNATIDYDSIDEYFYLDTKIVDDVFYDMNVMDAKNIVGFIDEFIIKTEESVDKKFKMDGIKENKKSSSNESLLINTDIEEEVTDYEESGLDFMDVFEDEKLFKNVSSSLSENSMSNTKKIFENLKNNLLHVQSFLELLFENNLSIKTKQIFYYVSATSTVKMYKDRPLRFTLDCIYMKDNKSAYMKKIKLVVCDKNNKTKKLEFDLNEKVEIVLYDEEVSELECFIVLVVNNYYVKLSESTVIEVVE